MENREHNVELLAPAGNFECLNAAVRAGANAVYLGLDHFNARRGADNFTIDTLKDTCDYAHLHDSKIYLTLNIIIFETEFKKVVDLAYNAAKVGVDAFIVQDIGLAKILSEEIPSVGLHISTQMNIHDEEGLRQIASLGAKRVTLARELSLHEIKHLCSIGEELGVEIETFAHGAICVCYSGQCLMSSVIGGRSANRGRCAQACRLNYELKSGKWALGKRRSGEDEKRGKYLLSPKDYCTIEILPELIDTGVSSLKIEGRMKSPEYVNSVISVYRKAIDKIYCDNGNYIVEDSDIWKLQEAFSRGFTQAYMKGLRGNEIMSYNRPNNRGLNIGRVEYIDNKKVVISAKHNLSIGDILEVWTNSGRSTIKINKDSALYDKKVEIHKDRADVSWKFIKKNDRVFRVRSSKDAFVQDLNLSKIKVDCKLKLKIGKPACIKFSNEKHYVELIGDVVEEARTKAVSVEEVQAHINRLGQTSFEIDNFDIEMDENVGLSFSQLHHLRAEALDKLKNIIIGNSNDVNKPEISQRNKKSKIVDSPKIVALAVNPNVARIAKRNGVDKIYVPELNYKRGTSIYAGCASIQNSNMGYPKDIVIMNSTVYPGDNIVSDRVYCDSLGSLYSALNKGAEVELGYHVPVTNVESLNYFENLGVKKIWLSPELSIDQISNLAHHSKKVSFGLIIVGAQELMITKHCQLMSMGYCSLDCANCKRRQTNHYLLDRKGYEFPVITDIKGNTHIYNSVCLDVCHCIGELIDAGIDTFMVDTTLMSEEEAAHAIGRAKYSLTNAADKSKNTTTGHLFRPLD